MARGWDSKAVEAQRDAAAPTPATRAAAVGPEQVERVRERATLMLARTRALSALQHACAPAHRAMLESTIADLDARLAALADTASS